jgi:hypothetical protein
MDLWLRILDIIHDSSAETLAAFIADINDGNVRPLDEYALEMSSKDMLAINGSSGNRVDDFAGL